MELLDELKKWFAFGFEGNAIELESVNKDYPAWVVRFDGEFGVAVPYDGNPVYEEFANARIFDKDLLFNGTNKHCLILTSESENTRNEFAFFCADFIEPGDDGVQRQALLHAPVLWWRRWKKLIGNAIVEKKPYAVLGELITYYYLIGKGVNPVWMGPNRSSSDIVADDSNNEVKSTVSRYGKTVKISGQFQLQAENLYLYFLRFEKQSHGISINDMVKKLAGVGQDEIEINRSLKKLGYGVGNSSRDERYFLLEMLKYTVNESFPKIVPESFVYGAIPTGITHISYDVNLEVLSAETIYIDRLIGITHN